MAERSVPAVVPTSGDAPGAAPSRATAGPLPLGGMPPRRRESLVISAIASMDGRGRVADRSVVRALGWGPGQRVQFRPLAEAVLVWPDAAGVFTVTGQGYLRVPAAVRHWCSLAAGQRVFVTARPDPGVVIVQTLAAVEQVLAEHHAVLLGGDHA